MLKMSIADAAEHFGVSKEAIHNRIRRGSLQSVVEDNTKFVMIDNNAQTPTKRGVQKSSFKKTDSSSDDRYYKLLEEQNAKLQNRVELLESETRTLREQKERMLIEERIKIEQIYKDKDEQLKNILNAISSKFMLNAPISVDEPEHLEAEIEETPSTKSELISLKSYLNEGNFSKKRKEKIKHTFKKRAKKDNRIIVIGKKYYIDLYKYDYSDLI